MCPATSQDSGWDDWGIGELLRGLPARSRWVSLDH